MTHDIYQWFISLPSNSMFAGLTGATVIGALLVMARQLPLRLARWILLAVSAQVTVKSEDPVFWWIVNWLSESDYGRSARRMRLESKTTHSDDSPSPAGSNEQEQMTYVLSPSDGMHWFFHRAALLVVSRGKESGGPGGHAMRAREEITVRAFSLRARTVIAELIQEARDSLVPSDSITRVYTNQDWGWNTPLEVPRRPISSVILRAGVAESLVADAKQFFEHKQWYRDRAIPWRRGYLLYGPPGCGKSSIAHALASELGMNIAAMSLASVVSDTALRSLMLSLPRRCLLLIEDIDAAFVKRESKDTEFISFSGLLNVIDGIAAAEGRILVMTTNHIEKVDPALRRSGRTDIEQLIDVADERQAKRLFLRFFPEEEELAGAFSKGYAGQCPAAIQGALIANRTDAEAACVAMAQTQGEAA
jgi:chaperone BCS1